MLMHGTCVCIDGKGVLILGDAGSGKSELALRLIDRGAVLVADDQVELLAVRKELVASVPPQIEGLFEVRGVGIFQMAFVDHVPLSLVVKLVPRTHIERMPDPMFFDCLEVRVPLLLLHSFDHATDAKIRLFLKTA
ncbi:MAG: HPr kinase/phosphatase C-terminal domain-containing protein [Rickettsiales bacterium]|nr:HPr kinase/phosphatase C-terminal domain-containing protein [Rickettsiales bacterium]